MRKIKVLVYLNHDKKFPNACTMYRHFNPYKYAKGLKVKYAYDVKASWDVDVQHKRVRSVDIDFSLIDWADVIVFARFYFQPAVMGAVAGYAMSKGKAVIYETDDLIHRIEDNIGDAAPEQVRTAMRFIDWLLERNKNMSVSTQYLKDFYQKEIGGNVEVLPNYYNPSMWRGLYLYKKIRDFVRKKILRRNAVRIGWQGGNNHFLKNFNHLIEPLNQLKKKYGNKVEFVSMGANPNVKLFENHQKKEALNFPFESREPARLFQFPRKLAEMDLDIGLIVVDDNPFSRAKSNIKWMEYSILGIPSVSSRCLPYENTNAILVGNTEEEWLGALSKLIDDGLLRKKMGKEAKKMSKEFNASKHGQKWYNYYKKIMDE